MPENKGKLRTKARNFQFYGAFIFSEMLIDLITGYAIISSWQHFGNRKSVSQNKVCK